VSAFEEGLYWHLSHDAGVIALVGSRIYPQVIPQDVALPAMAYQRISGPRDHTHSGPSGLARARVQITCSASSYSQAKGVAAAVRESVDGFKGTMLDVTVGAAFVEDEIDGYGTSQETFTVRLDVNAWYQE